MNIVTKMVEFKANGGLAPGYLAQPDGEGQFPGVVVIQEWWGLDDHIKDLTRRFAAEGFIALAPDLYRGKVADEPDDARKLVMELDRPQAKKDIQGAVNYLIAQPSVVPKKAGIVGFCMGGGLSSMMSYSGEHVGAVIVFYGGGAVLSDEDASNVTAPYLGLYGELDKGIPLEQVRANEEKLKEHGKTCEFVIYPGAQHAFFNDGRPAFHKEAAADAWKRSLGWFQQYLSV